MFNRHHLARAVRHLGQFRRRASRQQRRRGGADGGEHPDGVVAFMGNEASRHKGTAILRRGNHRHLRHRLCRNIAKPHQWPAGKPDRLETGLQPFVGIELRRTLIPGDPEVGCAHHHNRHAVVDHRDLDPLDEIHGIAGRQQGPAHGTCHIVKDQRHRRRTAGNTVDGLVTRIGRHAAGRMDCRRCHLPRIAHENPDIRAVAVRFHKTTLDREPADTGKDVSAILRVGHNGLVDEHLQEQIVDIGICATGPRDHGDLACQRVRPAHAVDLPGVGRPHHAQQQRVTGGCIGGQVVRQEVTALRGAAPHPHASCTGIRHDFAFVSPVHPAKHSARRGPGAIKAWQ